MISRREVVTAGVLGTLTNTAISAPAEANGQQDEATAAAVMRLEKELQNLRGVVERGLIGPSLSAGFIAEIRERLTTYLRTSGKFPEFMEIGTAPFYDVYDWHVRYSQPIQISRIAEQRFAIQFMYTQLVVRWEQDRNYIGIPYDR